MKTKYILTAFLLSILLASCETDVVVDPDFTLSFQEKGETTALAGTTFYVKVKGNAEYLTLYDGRDGFEWDSVGAKGIDFNLADSMPVTYNVAGTYNLTVVATTSYDFGKSFERVAKTVEVNVVDNRNEFLTFKLNGTLGTITADKEINFSFPDNMIDFNFAPEFTFNSPDAKAYVSGVEQVSGVSQQNFNPSGSVVYVVKSKSGVESTYTVKISTFPASNEKQLLSFDLLPNTPNLGYVSSNGETAEIDETNKVVNLAINYGTVATASKLTVSSSPLSNVFINNVAYSATRRYNLNTITAIKVVAQNSTEQTYSLNLTTQDPVVSFTFAGLVPAPVAIIDKVAKTITIDVLSATDITKLVAKWTGSVGTVKIGSVVQTNGVTENDFTSSKTYTFYKGTTAGDSYTITVIKK